MSERKEHWEKVYETKQPQEVSWTQDIPETSLGLIKETGLPKTASIIDIGGGDSKLVDFLLEEGYTDITVLDISEKSLERAKARLGDKADKVKWIAADITEFKPERDYDIWHDRAVFHFLTTDEHVVAYRSIAEASVNHQLIVGTFSDKGPKKCSGLDVRQYNEPLLTACFANGFEKTKCFYETHTTPFGTEQSFIFCSFMKKQ